MGIRFRRSFKIAPGLKLNLGKSSVGLSAGVKGAHVSINSKGRQTTSVGIPGTGLSYVSSKSTKSKAGPASSHSDETYRPASKQENLAMKAEKVKSKYSQEAIKRFSVIFLVLGILLILLGLVLTLATPVGLLFAAFGGWVIYNGKWYSKISKGYYD